MNTDDKYVALVLALNRKTQEGILKWRRFNPPDSISKGTDSIISNLYIVPHKNKVIGIFEERYRDSDYSSDGEWVNAVRLVLFNSDLDIDYNFPNISGLYELMDSIKHQVSGVQELFDDFLDKDDLQKIEEERISRENKLQNDLPF